MDPLGYFLPPWAYARGDLLEQAITATKSIVLTHAPTLFACMRERRTWARCGSARTASGPSRGSSGQFQQIHGNDPTAFKNPATEVVLLPGQYQSGALICPDVGVFNDAVGGRPPVGTGPGPLSGTLG